MPIPEATDLYTEQAMLTQYINNIIANNENLSKYQQFYYPAASKCYAYQPTVKAGEELANKFKYHNWYLPSVGELMRMYWHARQGVNYDDDKIGAIFQKAIDAGILNDFSNSWYWVAVSSVSSAAGTCTLVLATSATAASATVAW